MEPQPEAINNSADSHGRLRLDGRRGVKLLLLSNLAK